MAKDDIVDAEEGAPSTDTFATGIVIFTKIGRASCRERV